MKNIKIKFRGIDGWNRPVFKDIDRNSYFGSVNTLFNYEDTSEKVIAYFKDNIDELEWFGTSFGCEPMGGISKNITLEIVE